MKRSSQNAAADAVFTTMPVPRAYFSLALPVVLGMVVSLVYNLTDTWFIAQTGSTELVAGVSLCAPLFTLMVAFGDVFGLGGSTAISRLLGQKRDEEAEHMSAFCLYAAVVFGAATGAVLLLFQNQILVLLGAEADTLPYARDYYLILAGGSPFIILNIVPNNLLRTEGLAKEAMFCTIAGSLVNIVLDPILIFSAGMGAGGAALATLISNAAGDALFFIVICKKARHITILPGRARITAHAFWEILSIGIPASLTNIMQSLAVLLTNRLLLPYGTDQVAAYGIAMKVNMICTLIMVGAAFGAQPLLGYSYGAGAEKRLSALIRFDILTELVISAVFVTVSFGAAPAVVRLFMKDPAIVSAGTAILRAAMISQPAVGVVLVCTTLFQAEGRALPAFVLSLARQGFVLWICLAVFSRAAGLPGILYSQALSDGLTLLVSLAFLRGSGRRRTEIPEAQ
jgi:multidrug efflux pump